MFYEILKFLLAYSKAAAWKFLNKDAWIAFRYFWKLKFQEFFLEQSMLTRSPIFPFECFNSKMKSSTYDVFKIVRKVASIYYVSSLGWGEGPRNSDSQY